MNKTIIYILFLAALMLNSCSLLNLGKTKTESPQEQLTRKDSLDIRAQFIEAKKEALLGNDALAMEKYKAVLDKDPAHDAAMFEMARMHSKFNDYKKALKYAEKAIDIQPDNTWYRKMLVDLYQRTGQLDKSREHLWWLVENEGKKKFLQNLFNLERYQGNYKEALDVLKKMEDLTGTNQKNMLRKVRLYQELDEYEKAAVIARKLLKKDSTNADYYRELVDLYNRINEDDKAVKVIKKFKKSGVDSGKAELMLANQYREMGYNEKSFQALRKAIGNENLDMESKAKVMMSYYSVNKMTDSLHNQAAILLEELGKANPEHPVTYSLKGDFYMKDEKFTKALDAFENVIRLDSTKYPVWEQVLQLQFQKGMNKKVIQYSKKAKRLFPQQPMIYFMKGAAYTRINKHEKAVETFESGLYFVVRSQLKVDFYSYLGDNYHELGQYESSDNAYEKALKLDPENHYVLNNYAYYLSLRKRNLDKANKMITKVLKKHPGNATYLDTKGWVLFQQGKYSEAEKVFEKAIKNGGLKSAEILEHYGDCLLMLNKNEKAVKYWKKALNIKPDAEKLRKKIQQKTLKVNTEQ